MSIKPKQKRPSCSHDGCKKIPNFNNKGEKKGLYCSKHKLSGMINVKDKTCSHDGCNTIPNFNKEGEKIGLYCNEHKKPGMINVTKKTCSHDGCNKQPSFNKEGSEYKTTIGGIASIFFTIFIFIYCYL